MKFRRSIVVVVVLSAIHGLSNPAVAAPATEPVDAAALVTEIKQSEDWMAHVKSFRLKFDRGPDVAPRSFVKSGITAQPQPATTQPAGPPTLFSEIAFDETRLYTSIRTPNALVSMRFWDGQLSGYSGREGYIELTDSPESVKGSFMTNLTWGRVGQNYWWGGGNSRQNDLIGPPTDYNLVGTGTLNGVECYVLQRNASPAARCYVGVADHRLYGWGQSVTYWYADYKEVAPGCWYPMTQGDMPSPDGRRGGPPSQNSVVHVTEIAVNEPLPELFFKLEITNGTHVHDLRGGKSLDYVKREDSSPEEAAEVKADAARRQAYGPPPLPPGNVLLNPQVDPLPLNPLALHPASEFPEPAQWLNGGPVKLSDCRGKVVLIVFWASWQEFIDGLWGRDSSPPDLKMLAAVKQDVVVVGVHVPTNNPGKVESAIQKYAFQFPVCIDIPLNGEVGAWGQMADHYRVDQLSVTYVIDQDGKIATLGSWPVAVRRAQELLGKAPAR